MDDDGFPVYDADPARLYRPLTRAEYDSIAARTVYRPQSETATLAATVYHYLLGRVAPYALSSLPVLLGTLGGLMLVVGPAGLLWLNLRRHPQHGDPDQRALDRSFTLLLLLSSLGGLAC